MSKLVAIYKRPADEKAFDDAYFGILRDAPSTHRQGSRAQ